MLDQLMTMRAGLLALAVVLALFGISNAFVAVFFQSRFEVTWNFEETVRYCSKGSCTYYATLSVANTGTRMQERASVELAGLPPGVRAGHSVLDLSAAEPRAGDPEVTEHVDEKLARFELLQFQPGTLVQLYFSGYYAEAEQPRTAEVKVDVKARGRVTEADPRAITLGRYLTRNASPAPENQRPLRSPRDFATAAY